MRMMIRLLPAVTLAAIYLSASAIAIGEVKVSEEIDLSTWVKFQEAGYDEENPVKGTKNAEMIAKKLPAKRVTELMSQEDWEAFISEYPRNFRDAKNFAPDFGKVTVLVLSIDKAQRVKLGDLMDVELYEAGDRVKFFAFFEPHWRNPSPAAAEQDAGHLILVSVPRKLAGRGIDFRLAVQSWGRACSGFSPVIAGEKE
jgi:hypothetical protein